MYNMLEKLRIQNYAIIEQLDLELPNGFIVLTGETGAGKSIIFDAIQLLQGSRANSDMIRTGKRSASVEGKYVLSPFEFARIYPTLVELGCCDFDSFDVQSNTKKSMYSQVEDTIAKYFESISTDGDTNTVVSKEISTQNKFQAQKEQELSSARILELKSNLIQTLTGIFEKFPREERVLEVRRSISRSGSSRILVNGTRTNVKNLQKIMVGIVDIIGQHASHDLLQSSNHIDMLDAFAGTKKQAQLVAKKVLYLHKLQNEIRKLYEEEEYRSTRRTSLQKQFDEIEMAGVSEGEDERLELQLDRLSNAEMIRERSMTSVYLLQDGEGSSVDQLNIAIDQLRRIAYLDPNLEQCLETLERCNIEISEMTRDIRRFAEEVIVSPDEISFLQERLELIRTLKSRHGGRVEDIIKAKDIIQQELDVLYGQENRIHEAECEAKELEQNLMKICIELSKKRQNAGQKLSKIVECEIQTLGMPNCRFEVSYKFFGWNEINKSESLVSTVEEASTSSLTMRGLDHVEFLIAPNLGEEFKALARIASGGELSRLLLALKGALISTDPVETYIFDEVDTGIGGGVAESVGRKLRNLGEKRQVLCITHLPQVACCGHSHLHVSKKIISEDVSDFKNELNEKIQDQNQTQKRSSFRTVSVIQFMSVEERIQEIARMLGGVELTDRTLDHAQELLQQNQVSLRLVQNIS
jgi:DNA repair protein RecN (Recombination protein N)